jgi:hypothetical protein
VRPAGALLALVAAIELALGLYLAAGGASFPVTPWQAVVLIAIPLTALLAVLGSVVACRRKLGSSRAMQVAGGLGVLVGVAGTLLGVALAFYASWLVLGEYDNVAWTLRIGQFAFACAVPLAAGLLTRTSWPVIRQGGGLSAPLVSVAAAAAALGAWVLTYFEWW